MDLHKGGACMTLVWKRTGGMALLLGILLGGACVSALPEYVMAKGMFDFGVLGEGEITARELRPELYELELDLFWRRQQQAPIAGDPCRGASDRCRPVIWDVKCCQRWRGRGGHRLGHESSRPDRIENHVFGYLSYNR